MPLSHLLRSLPHFRGARSGGRLQKIDIFRGLALLGMGVYHFIWDLAYCGYMPYAALQSGILLAAARCVAGSFLFLAGFSLFLAQGQGFQCRAYFRRLLIIALCAALVSAATYIFMPQNFIYFGILHEIALASLVGLLFLRTPLSLNCLLILGCFLLPRAGFNAASPALWWLGLSSAPAPSLDYVPFFPWFACALAGQTAAGLLARLNWLRFLRRGLRPHCLSRFMQFLGRRSLALYLLHQPLLLGGLLLFAHIAPPSYQFARAGLEQDCAQSCALHNAAQPCGRFCACVLDGLYQQNLLAAYMRGRINADNPRIIKQKNSCAGLSFAAAPQR